MYQQKKPRDYKNLWIISLILIVIGVVLTFRLAMIRPLGFVLLAVGGFLVDGEPALRGLQLEMWPGGHGSFSGDRVRFLGVCPGVGHFAG